MARHTRSSAWPLAWAWIGLIVYASLHPFNDWHLPPWGDRQAWLDLLRLPMPRRAMRFDFVANLLGYIPLGMLVALGALRDGMTAWRALLLAVVTGAGLSYAMESTQHLLPLRVPSLLDWLLNSAGSLLGAALAWVALRVGLLRWWQMQRDLWFVPHGFVGMLLVLSWPVGLLFPPPLPFGLGQGLSELATWLDDWLADTPLAGWVPLPDASVAPAPGTELLGVALGALAPCFVAYTMARRPHHRLVLMLGALLLGTGATALSTALNFGPDHADAWLTRPVLPGLVTATVLGSVMAWLPRRAVAALGLIGITLLVSLVNQTPADPYFAASLEAWSQGRFIRFHGIAQWVGWFWPFAALGFLLLRAAERDTHDPHLRHR